MNLADLIDESDMLRARDMRREVYVTRAADFLRRHFAPAMSTLSDSDIRGGILDAANETRQMGLSSEKDHLNFLIARILLGRRFFLNPALHSLLYRAGWIDDDGYPARVFTFSSLFQQIDERELSLTEDLASSHALIRRFARLYQPDPPQGINALAMVLPALSRTMQQREAEALAALADQAIAAVGLPMADRDSFICVAALLGCEFHRDPFHAGIARALTIHPKGSEAQREAYADALAQTLQSRLLPSAQR